jgi:hypothetical protein
MNKMKGVTVATRTITCRFEQAPKEFLEGRFDKLRFTLSHGIRIVMEYLLSMKQDEFTGFMSKAINASSEWNENRKKEIREMENK